MNLHVVREVLKMLWIALTNLANRSERRAPSPTPSTPTMMVQQAEEQAEHAPPRPNHASIEAITDFQREMAARLRDLEAQRRLERLRSSRRSNGAAA